MSECEKCITAGVAKSKSKHCVLFKNANFCHFKFDTLIDSFLIK